MLRHITVAIIVDDHEPEKCGECTYDDVTHCDLLFQFLDNGKRCKECLEGAK